NVPRPDRVNDVLDRWSDASIEAVRTDWCGPETTASVGDGVGHESAERTDQDGVRERYVSQMSDDPREDHRHITLDHRSGKDADEPETRKDILDSHESIIPISPMKSTPVSVLN